MCRNCGAIVGAGQQQCAVCGRSTAPVASAGRRAPDTETLRFARAVLDRPYKFTIIFLVANFFLFLMMWQSSGMSMGVLGLFPENVLVAYGAKVNSLVRENHQWWRLVTPMFLHVNLIHLLVNMYSLWVVGPYVEKLYGSAKFVVFWVVTGIAALVASYFTVVTGGVPGGSLGAFIFKTHDAPSVGASGALFGLVGVLFVFGIKFRRELPEGFKRAFGTGLLPMIMLNLFIGYVGRGIIDNAAHLGGLVAGAALALVVDYRRPGERSAMAMTWQVLQIAAIALVIVSFIKTAQHFRDPLPSQFVEQRAALDQSGQLRQPAALFITFVQAMTEAQETFDQTLRNHDASRVDTAVKKLDAAPLFDADSTRLKEELKGLVVEAKDVIAIDANTESNKRIVQQKQSELVSRFLAWSKGYNAWLKTSGRNFGGIEIPE